MRENAEKLICMKETYTRQGLRVVCPDTHQPWTLPQSCIDLPSVYLVCRRIDYVVCNESHKLGCEKCDNNRHLVPESFFMVMNMTFVMASCVMRLAARDERCRKCLFTSGTVVTPGVCRFDLHVMEVLRLQTLWPEIFDSDSDYFASKPVCSVWMYMWRTVFYENY